MSSRLVSARSWSRATAGIDEPAALLAGDRLLAQFAPTRARAQTLYRRFVGDGVGERLEELVVAERVGGEPFLRERFGFEPQAEIPHVQLEPLPPSLEELFGTGDPTPIRTAYREHGYTLREIAEHLRCHYSTVSRKLRQQEVLSNA